MVAISQPTLDAELFVDFAKQVSGARFHRRVAAAMQHEAGIAAQQPRRVGAQCNVPAHAGLGVALYGRGGVGIVPAALHV
jgi:hypothetical protein